ncbi:MAG: dihydrofolate reductase family protein [Actinobacteria bacterium]|nr:dihydrofolate reductase family protein [Actinomycetota bacterium]OJU86108.1 MAG: deaminase [Solirubrobacterales bacterium 70-9]
MPKVKSQITISLDGYMAGPNQSEENPLGEGGEALHEWAFKLASFNEMHGRGEAGERGPSDDVLRSTQENLGAVVIGRNMFGPVRGPWPDEEWKGWWGDDPPFHCPVYVLTHYPRDPFELENGNSFHFVTDGIEKAIAGAKEAADDQDVSVGGASTLQQTIAAGLLDEIVVTQVPVILGGGVRLFDHLAPGAAEVELAEVVEGAEALHLTYRLR